MKSCQAFKFEGVSLDDDILIGFMPTLVEIDKMAGEHAFENVKDGYIYPSEQTENEEFARQVLLDFYY